MWKPLVLGVGLPAKEAGIFVVLWRGGGRVWIWWVLEALRVPR